MPRWWTASRKRSFVAALGALSLSLGAAKAGAGSGRPGAPSRDPGQTIVRTEAQVRLREYKTPLRDRNGQRIATFIDLEHEGTQVEQDFQSTIPGVGSSSGHVSCPVSTQPGQAGVSHGSALYLKSAAGDTTPTQRLAPERTRVPRPAIQVLHCLRRARPLPRPAGLLLRCEEATRQLAGGAVS